MSETERQGHDMITADEAATILSVSRTTIHRLVKSGQIPSPPTNPILKRPRKLMLARADVERLKQPAAPYNAAPADAEPG